MRWWRIWLHKFRRRPCESRDPYAAALHWGKMTDDFFYKNQLWLWAPAFAGATETSRPKALRRTRDRRATARRHLHHGEAPFIGAIGPEAEQAIDAGKAGRIGQRLRRKTLPALCSRQRRRSERRPRNHGIAQRSAPSRSGRRHISRTR